VYLVDAMSSFGGIPVDMHGIGADFLISSANKCVQGVPGFGFAIARREELESMEGRARSLSLDLYDQWETMEKHSGKWRFTSPTHVVRAFAEALRELDGEGGVHARHARYRENQRLLVTGMQQLGFDCFLPREYQSPIITSFHSPQHPSYDFKRFYEELKSRGFVIYPGKVTSVDTFRIGSIGDIDSSDIQRLLGAVRESVYWPRAIQRKGEDFPFLDDLPRFPQVLQGPSDTDAMGSNEKTQIFMGQRELNDQTCPVLKSVFLGNTHQHSIKTIFQVC
jgi:2-aminoethylphosphonate-pyruvate transaminase